MLNKILASLTLILLLSLVVSIVFWSDDAHPSMFTDGFVVALVKVAAIFVIITSVRLCLSLFNGEKAPVSSGETTTPSPRNVNLKYTYATIALSLIAPFMVAITMMAFIPIEVVLSKIMWEMEWAPYAFWTNLETQIAIGFIFQIVTYALIAWSLHNLYKQYRSGAISTRSFAYPAIITGISFIFAMFLCYLTLTSGA
jgi:hypothetical protein